MLSVFVLAQPPLTLPRPPLYPSVVPAGSLPLPTPSHMFDFEGHQHLLFAPTTNNNQVVNAGVGSSMMTGNNVQGSVDSVSAASADSHGGWMSFDIAEDTCRWVGCVPLLGLMHQV